MALECMPIYAFWESFDPVNPMDPSTYICRVDQYKLSIGAGVSNIFIDLFLLLLPLAYIWKLRLSLAQKLAVTCTFVGGFL
ncbi:hypothetical protein VFPPC_15696 [Pochonia chlamydosporia 170]|uniref:Rhodopsin domain-containing protein n=1 Tax=Pochonia chlamydosporia 170 TaxID=1380566 RepID=A0A179G0Q2_METCM|nr:hypothetical protein VFPPC_15696 [Pochonia chlamydosporia 170]OAQ71432.2 hypothetical protein VFPPC_15696 [Pochonia chlamydosporia 170]